MLVADLKSMASGLGISGAGSMTKPRLIQAIKDAQTGARSSDQSGGAQRTEAAEPKQSDAGQAPKSEKKKDKKNKQGKQQVESRSQESRFEEVRSEESHSEEVRHEQREERRHEQDHHRQQNQNQGAQQQSQNQQAQAVAAADGESGSRRNRRRRGRDRDRVGQPGQPGGQPTGQQSQQGQGQPGQQGQHGQQSGHQGGRGPRNEPDTTILDDDILVPAAGILDVLDNYAFVRTSGYLPGTEDVYVSLSMVRKYGLRRGDAIVGQVRQPREGERREKFNPMVRIDAVNGADPDGTKHRPEFAKLTPLNPTERLRLETGPDNLIGRIIDIASPIGKGQRGLVVSPASSGKTTLLRSVAASITQNNPECHLMVVLLDERPEEVTDFERSVKGEVIASTFDRPPADHTAIAELAIERAKRLVELGHDVVVLLDGLTRLGRAYNLSMPVAGRVLAGGVDAGALYPPKKFFGAARNIENGGSLTILATASIESGSAMDEVLFEDFRGTANLEIRLRRELADLRLFPAIDAVQSGTRSEEELLGPEELEIVWKLRRQLSGQEPAAALEQLLGRLRSTQTNIEFLRQVQAD
jgi:transcription termination factor Rho